MGAKETTMNDETTKHTVKTAIYSMLEPLLIYLTGRPADVLWVMSQLATLLPGRYLELSLGTDAIEPVELLVSLPGARVSETLYAANIIHREPFVIRCVEAQIGSLRLRAQHTRPPTPEELAKLAPAAPDPEPRVKPVHLRSTTLEPSRSP